jgi:hypothetical protein
LKVKYRSPSGNDVLEGFLGVIVRAVTLPLDKVSKAVLFCPFRVKYKIDCL